jgi:hypothetical protein
LLAQPTFSPQSYVSESAASIASEVAFPRADRLVFEREDLFPLAGLDPASAARYLDAQDLVHQLEPAQVSTIRDYLDGTVEFLRAGERLEHEALMAHPEATLKYVNEFRSYALTYTVGKIAAHRRIFWDTSPENSWRRYREWISSPPWSAGQVHHQLTSLILPSALPRGRTLYVESNHN